MKSFNHISKLLAAVLLLLLCSSCGLFDVKIDHYERLVLTNNTSSDVQLRIFGATDDLSSLWTADSLSSWQSPSVLNLSAEHGQAISKYYYLGADKYRIDSRLEKLDRYLGDSLQLYVEGVYRLTWKRAEAEADPSSIYNKQSWLILSNTYYDMEPKNHHHESQFVIKLE